MKKLFTLLVILLTYLTSFSQNGINYKAIIKDNLGNVVANSSVDVLFAIFEGAALTNNVYQETHSPTTDANGIIIVNIGEGSQVFGNYSTIDWGNDEHFLYVSIDVGNGWVDMGTTEFKAVPYAKHADTAGIADNVTGLEALDEGGGIGWRIKGRSTNNYGNIGLGATDLSYSSIASETLGATGLYATSLGYITTSSGAASLATGYDTKATGDYSVALGYGTNATQFASISLGDGAQATGSSSIAIGYRTIASGSSSTAMGSFSEASGINSTAMGDYTEAIGENSSAMGNYSNASGGNSIAMGLSTFASGNQSLAMGDHSTASGIASTAMGYYSTAQAYSSVAMGRFNVGNGNSSSWVNTDPLFEIGNGTNNNNRNNVLTILKNGNIGIGFLTPSDMLHINNPSSGNAMMRFTNSTTGTTTNDGFWAGLNTNGHGYLWNHENNKIIFGTNNLPRLYVDEGGNIGIGVSEPTDKLQINNGTSGSSMIRFTNSTTGATVNDGLWLGLNYTGNNSIWSFENNDLIFGTNNASRIVIKNNGNVGIGKSSGINGRVEIASASGLTSPQLYINETTTGYARLNFSNANRSDYWAIGAYIGATSSADRFNFYNSGTGTDIMSIEGSGNVRVNGTIVHSSDIRLKKDITPIPYGLKEVLLLNPKSYNWKNRETMYKSFGLIAQDVQPIIKEIVHIDTDEAKTLSVSYTELIPILIKALQEQQEIINKQDFKIDVLKVELEKLKTLEERFDQLESLIKTANK